MIEWNEASSTNLLASLGPLHKGGFFELHVHKLAGLAAEMPHHYTASTLLKRGQQLARGVPLQSNAGTAMHRSRLMLISTAIESN